MNLTQSSSRPRHSLTANRRAAFVSHLLCVRPRHGGFTLVELIVVVAIIATVGSIGLVRYSNSLTRYRLTIAAERIAADIELTRTRARTASALRSIVFDVSNNTYRITSETMTPKSLSPYVVNLASEPFHLTLATASFAGDEKLTFDAFGHVSGSGGVRLRAGAKAAEVRISSTGAITIVGP